MKTKKARRTKDYRADVRRLQNPRGFAIKTLIHNLEKMLEQIEPTSKTCAVCGGKFRRVTKRLGRYRHTRMCEVIGRVEARKIQSRLRATYGMKFWKNPLCTERFEFECDHFEKHFIQATVCGKTIVVPVCSEECRERQRTWDEEYDQCLLQHHDNWQQVRAIRIFLRTQNPDALRFLRPGLGPALSSPDSCRH